MARGRWVWMHEIGSLEVGKRADVAVVRSGCACTRRPLSDLVSALVYSAQPTDVQTVIIDGRVVMRDRKLLTLDEDGDRSKRTRRLELLKRAGLGDN